MRANACEIQLELFGTHRRRRLHQRLIPERRHGVWINDFADYALAVLIVAANVEIPIAQFLAAVMLLRRIFVNAAPLVETIAVFGIEIFAVLRVAGAGVGIGGDQQIGFVAHACFSQRIFHNTFFVIQRNQCCITAGSSLVE